MGPALGQPPETSLFTNLTFAARIDYYHDQIQEVMALPEPGAAAGLGWGISLLAWLARRRAGVRGAPQGVSLRFPAPCAIPARFPLQRRAVLS